jgi:hypothetical protein
LPPERGKGQGAGRSEFRADLRLKSLSPDRRRRATMLSFERASRICRELTLSPTVVKHTWRLNEAESSLMLWLVWVKSRGWKRKQGRRRCGSPKISPMWRRVGKLPGPKTPQDDSASGTISVSNSAELGAHHFPSSSDAPFARLLDSWACNLDKVWATLIVLFVLPHVVAQPTNREPLAIAAGLAFLYRLSL